MKKIVPFNNVLNFSTDVREITAISLEHTLHTESDLISGSFYISGEYKMTDGQLEREKFNFELPFDIALGNDYERSSLVVDIDDFRYELVDRNKLKVNIDLYIDGEILPKEEPEEAVRDLPVEEVTESQEKLSEEEITKEEELRTFDEQEEQDVLTKEELPKEIIKEKEEILNDKEVTVEEPTQIPIQERIDLLEEMLTSTKEEPMKEEENNTNNNENINNNINIFNGFNEEENYVTYRVYRVLDTDTIDKILEKYNITKEDLAAYNNIEDIKPGDKLIIKTNDK